MRPQPRPQGLLGFENREDPEDELMRKVISALGQIQFEAIIFSATFFLFLETGLTKLAYLNMWMFIWCKRSASFLIAALQLLRRIPAAKLAIVELQKLIFLVVWFSKQC